jgi:hypothetical protein
MPVVARLVVALALLGIGGFCVFGFLATYEPTNRNILPWRVGHGAVAIASVVGAGWLAWPRSSRR